MNPSRFRTQIALSLAGLALILGILAFGVSGASSSDNAGTTYVEAMVGAPRFVNPLLATSDTDTDLAHMVYSGLARVDDAGTLAPDLASGWQISPDTRTYTFTLRPNLKWHDGAPLTSADVYFTVNLLKNKDFPGDAALAARWRDVQPGNTGDDTVVFTLPKPDASFLQQTTLGIMPKHLWSGVNLDSPDPNKMPVGSGPWRYVRSSAAPRPTADTGVESSTTLTQGQSLPGVLLEPNPDSEMPSGSISHIWFRPYPTFGAALTGFSQGEVHGLAHIPPERLAEVRQVPGVTLHEATLARYMMLIINVASPLFDRPETRQAIELAIDRDQLARLADAQVTGSPFLPHSWANNNGSSVGRGYHPAEARRLLDSAGWQEGPDGLRSRNGTKLTVVLAASKDTPLNPEAARLISDDLKAVGIDLQLALVGHDSLVNDYLGPRAYHLALVNWMAGGADPDLYAYWHSSQNTTGFNYTGWSNPQADHDLQAALETSDQSARARLYADFQQQFSADTPAVVLYAPLYTYATREPAAGVTMPQADLLSPAQRFDTIENWYLRPGK